MIFSLTMRRITMICAMAALFLWSASMLAELPTQEDTPQTQSLWLEAERATPSDALDMWAGLLQQVRAGAALPSGVQAASILPNMIQAALRDEAYNIAQELADELPAGKRDAYIKLAVLRAEALASGDSPDAPLVAIGKYYDRYAPLMQGADRYHWMNAVATAALDVAPLSAPLPEWLIRLVPMQHMGRHRAYLEHRLALHRAGLRERDAAERQIDSAAFDALLDEQAFGQAYKMIAVLPLKQRGINREKYVNALIDAALRNAQFDAAINAARLHRRNSAQEKALIAVLEALIDAQRAGEASQLAEQLMDGKPRMMAYYRMRDMYDVLGMEAYKARYNDAIEQMKQTVEVAPLPAPLDVKYEPFKTLNRRSIIINAPQVRDVLSDEDVNMGACYAAEISLPTDTTPVLAVSEKVSGDVARMHGAALTMMITASRSIAGDEAATRQAKNMLLQWARAGALLGSDETHNAYFHLKRFLLPFIVTANIIDDALTDDERAEIVAWLEPVITPLDARFDGKVDENNHRYMADAILMAWGVYTQNDKLYHKGIKRFYTALQDARADGALPLEIERGARANWYMRQSIASLTAIAETAHLQGDKPYDVTVDGVSFDTLLHYFISAAYNPLLILPEAAANYNPGYEFNIFNPEQGYLEPRGNGRHYMAFALPLLAHSSHGFAHKRLAQLMENEVSKDGALLDDFIGGNMSCLAEGR